MIDLHFPVLGAALPADHGYGMYAALSRLVTSLHESSTPVRIGPVHGVHVGRGMLHLEPDKSRLRIRLPAENIPDLLKLAGKALNVEGHQLRLGVPQVRGLIPAPALIARLVTIKGFTDPGPFLDAVRRQLEALDIHAEPGIPLVESGPHLGEPRRKVLRVSDKQVVGFPLQVTGLTAEESIRLQEAGIGGRGKMGCGFFGAMREENQ